MQANGFDVLMISADGKEVPQLIQQEHCRHIIVPMTRSITPFRDMICIVKLIRIFKKERPDIVHTETPKAGLLGMIAAKLCGVKIRIHTVAGMPLMVVKGAKLRLLQSIEKITYAAATDVWPNGPSLESFIIREHFAPASKLKVIGSGSSNGVNTERFNRENLSEAVLAEVKKSVHYDKENTYLLFMGRFVKDKGLTELVNVFTALHTERPSLRLILAGDYEPHLDPLPADTHEKIDTHENIIHIPWSDHVEYYMAFSDYFVFPSYREGFPNVLLEAAAMKLPIVCSRITGNVDIVKHNETGLIFESENETDLKAKLLTALNNPARMTDMAEKLHQHIIKVYSRENFWESMRLEYNRLCGRQ